MSTTTELEYVTRLATVPFRLGRPEELPATPAHDAAAQRAERILLGLDVRTATGVRMLLDRARDVRDGLPPVPGRPVGDDDAESEENRDNDLAFGIVRTHGPVLELLTDAALAALIGILEAADETGSGLEPLAWQRLLGAFTWTFGWIAHPEELPSVPEAPAAELPRPPQPEDGLRRWIRGHHVFMALAQGCTLAHHQLIDAHQRGDRAAGAVAGRVAVALMEGCQGALRYAGDANKDQYGAEIRPTLMPPIAPPKMSGLHWRDHEALIAALAEGKESWAWLAGERPDLLTGFRAAMADSYRSHVGVCEHFVGPESPSLLATSGSQRSAVGVLSQFRKIRLNTLPDTPEDS